MTPIIYDTNFIILSALGEQWLKGQESVTNTKNPRVRYDRGVKGFKTSFYIEKVQYCSERAEFKASL